MSKTELELEDTRALEKAQRSAIDEKLLSNARKSPYELAELTGLGAEEAAERLSRLLEDRGWLTERQEERLLLIEASDLLRDARNRLDTIADEYYSPVARIVLGSMNLLADRYDARRKLVESDLEKLTAKDARIFGEAYDIALDFIFRAIHEMYPDFTDAEESDLKKSALSAAKRNLDEKIA